MGAPGVGRGWVGLTLIAATACGQASRQADMGVAATNAVPVYEEQWHRLVYRGPLVRIMDVRIPPAETTAYHVHADRMLGIAVQDARIWIQAPGAPPGPVSKPRATPYVFENWSQSLPYIHRVANMDTVPLHYLVAEWLGRSGPQAPALPDTPTRRLVKEGPTIRVYEITLEPRVATDPHAHAGPGLVVSGTAGGFSEEGSPKAHGGTGVGSWSWRDGAGRHVLRNDGPSRATLYEIDWR